MLTRRTLMTDRRAQSPQWSSDSQEVFYLASTRGAILIYRTDLNDVIKSVFPSTVISRGPGSNIAFTERRELQVSSFSLARNSQVRVGMAFTMSSSTRPSEVWLTNSAGISGALLLRISAHNDTLLRANRPLEPEEINFK